MTSTLSTVRQAILLVLDKTGEVHGTECLSLAINAPKAWTIVQLRRLQDQGEIRIIPSNGGRGRKTIYRRNRNAPGGKRK